MSFFWNSRIPYYIILGLDPRISIWNSRILEFSASLRWSKATEARNSRIFVIASEAKQSLGILNSSLGILEFLNDINAKSP